jgi:hypothetical protein
VGIPFLILFQTKGTDMDSFIIPPQDGMTQTPGTIDQKRRLAMAMMQQGVDSSPIASPWQGAARIMQAVMGGYGMNQANQQEIAGRQSTAGIYNDLSTGKGNLGQAMADPWVNQQTAIEMPGYARQQRQYNAIDQQAASATDPTMKLLWATNPDEAAKIAGQQLIGRNNMDMASNYGQSGQTGLNSGYNQGDVQQSAPMQGAVANNASQPANQGQTAAQPIPQPVDAQNTNANQPAQSGLITDPTQIPVPPEIERAARMAAFSNPADYAKTKLEWQQKQASMLNDQYYKSPAYQEQTGSIAATNAGGAKFEEAKAGNAASVISNIPVAEKRIQVLSQMLDILKNSGGNIASGPYASQILKMKQALVGAGFDVGDATAPSEMLSKLGTGLAVEDLKNFSRPTQAELKIFIANNPGLSLTPQGNMGLINLKMQLAQRDKAIGNIMMGKRYQDLPSVIDQYDKENPLRSPLTGKVLDANAIEYPAPNGSTGSNAAGSAVQEFNWTPEKGMHK